MTVICLALLTCSSSPCAGEHVLKCAPFVDRYWGVDNNASFIAFAKAQAAKAGIKNAHLIQYVSPLIAVVTVCPLNQPYMPGQ